MFSLIQQLLESNIPTTKAGCIPYIVEDDEIKMMFMISSDPDFGGVDPMISKGHIDEGESPDEAAIREAEEELGLKRSNIVAGSIKLGWHGELSGMTAHYGMDIFVCEVKSIDDFDEPHYETGEVLWLTPDEFASQGRRSQRAIVASCAQKIKN